MIQRLVIGLVWLVGCAPTEQTVSASNCEEATLVDCACSSGALGVQSCQDGRFTPCLCADATVPDDGGMGPANDAMSPALDGFTSDAERDDGGQSDAIPSDSAPPPPIPDGAPPPPIPVLCDGLEVVDFFTEAVSQDGRWHLMLDAPQTTVLEPASCGGEAAGVLIGFRAPYDGYWVIRTDGAGTDFDPVVRSYLSCPDMGPEETCVDDDETFAPTLAGHLAAGEVRLIVVSAWTGDPTQLELTAERVPWVRAGEDCGMDTGSACDGDHTCRPLADDPTHAVCERQSPPVLTMATARRQDDDLYTLSLSGRDESRDVWGLAVQYLDGEGNPISLDDETTFYAEAADAPLTADFDLGFRFSGLSDIPGVEALNVGAVDAYGAESEFRIVAFEPLPTAERNGACDPAEVVDVCPNSYVCHTRTNRCGPARSPAVMEGFFYLNREEATWGLTLEGTDENADVFALRFIVLNRRRERIELDGADVGDLFVGERIEVDGDSWRFAHSGLLPRSVDPTEVGYLQLIVIDRTGLTTEDQVLDVTPSPETAEGEPCDPNLVLDRCARGTRCQLDALGASTCRRPIFSCPPGVDLPRLEVGQQVSGSTYGNPSSRGHLTCAAGQVGIERYRFTAPETGRYAINVEADFDVIRYGSRGCLSVRFDDELMCVVGTESEGSLELDAGEEIYLRIGGRFVPPDPDELAYKQTRGHYQLDIERLP